MPLLRDSALDRAWGWCEVAIYAAAPVLFLKYFVPSIPTWLVGGVYLGLVGIILSFPVRKWYRRRGDRNRIRSQLTADPGEGKGEGRDESND